tara:strand:+ start:243 stop:557 length:315 start_codon:yes stop_codon:yes gene_type:complete
MSLLKLYRGPLVVETMPALRVVKHLNVVEHSSTSILPGAVDFSPDSLPFQQMEKAFSYHVVMAVTTPTYATKQVNGFQEALPVTAAELATLDALLSVKWTQCFG